MRMARLVSLSVLVVTLVLVPVASAQTLGAVLTGSQEVPPNANPGFGNATVVFDAARQNITVTITVANLGATINNFHIHEALGADDRTIATSTASGVTLWDAATRTSRPLK